MKKFLSWKIDFDFMLIFILCNCLFYMLVMSYIDNYYLSKPLRPIDIFIAFALGLNISNLLYYHLNKWLLNINKELREISSKILDNNDKLIEEYKKVHFIIINENNNI